jgi:hypothetical protein
VVLPVFPLADGDSYVLTAPEIYTPESVTFGPSYGHPRYIAPPLTSVSAIGAKKFEECAVPEVFWQSTPTYWTKPRQFLVSI